MIAEEGWEHVLSCKHSWDGSGEFYFFFKQGNLLRGFNISCPATELHSAVHYPLMSTTDLEVFTQMQV